MCTTTAHQVNAPFNNPVEGEPAYINVVDPTHPLFGRRFPLRWVSHPPDAIGHAFVAYRGHMVLKIPRSATDLAYTPSRLAAKLTVASLQELISLAKEHDLLCPVNSRTSGDDSPPRCNDASSKNSP